MIFLTILTVLITLTLLTILIVPITHVVLIVLIALVTLAFLTGLASQGVRRTYSRPELPFCVLVAPDNLMSGLRRYLLSVLPVKIQDVMGSLGSMSSPSMCMYDKLDGLTGTVYGGFIQRDVLYRWY